MAFTVSPRRRRTVLRATWLFDGVGSSLLPDRAVVLDGPKIIAVDRAAEFAEDAGIVDLPGTTLMPGMIDTHVQRSDAAQLLAGITTVRDLGETSLTVRGHDGLPTVVASGPRVTGDVRAAVRDRVASGSDVIAVTTDLPDLAAAVDEAHRHGLPVTAFARGMVRRAVESGVDGLEEVTEPEVVQVLADHRVVVGAALPRAHLAATRAMYEAGVPIVPGTGAGTVNPIDALPFAVPQLREIGMSPAESLRAVTSVGANVCRLAHRKGCLAPGFDADVIAVDGNPLTDPTALLRIRAVYAQGMPYHG